MSRWTIQMNKNKFVKRAFLLLQKNRPIIEQMLPDIFWVLHLKMHRPHETKTINELITKVGRIWGNFLFPFETDAQMDHRVRDAFVDSIPYFMTQCCQHIFVLISRGMPETTKKEFRMCVCATIVELFTRIQPLESLLQTKLASYFARPPQVDIISPSQQNKQQEFRTLLPVENLKSLIEIPRRKRPRSSMWSVAGISSLITASTHRKTVPFQRNSEIVVQYPKDGESDWTSDLPPLLPKDQPAATSLTFENYNPDQDSRSLLYRSRRPNLCEDYMKVKEKFQVKEAESNEQFEAAKKRYSSMKSSVKNTSIRVLKRFCEDVRVLQLERKWNESPEWHTDQELIEMEEQRIQRENQAKKEAEEEKAAKHARKIPKLLPFEIEELKLKHPEIWGSSDDEQAETNRDAETSSRQKSTARSSTRTISSRNGNGNDVSVMARRKSIIAT